ncbi:MAG: Xaa-Pro peptidase family protein [Veillonellales bacterium]
MANVNLPRLKEKMSAANMDAVVVVKPEFFYYTTGFQYHMGGMQSTPGSGRQLAGVAIIPRDENKEPAIIVSNWEQVPARENSWIKDVRVFPIWTEIFDLQDLLDNKLQRVEKHFQFDIKKNAETACQILKEKGLATGTIGIEFDYACQNVMSYFREALPQATFVDSSRMLYDVAAVKTQNEIDIIRKATKMTQKASLMVAQEELLGLTVGEVRMKYQMAVLKLASADPSAGYQDNKCTMSIGGDCAPKAQSAPYRAAKGDIIFFDPGINLKGYMADIGRSMVIGEPNELQTRVYSTLAKGVKAMMDAIKPGVKCSELFHIGQETIRNAGTGLHAYTRGHLGHAVGVSKNERAPFIAAFDHTVLEPNMVFSVEAPLYINGLGGFNVEDTIVVTEDGYENFCDWPMELIKVRC